MRLLIILLITLLLNNCSLNRNSKFWNENNEKNISLQKELVKIYDKSDNVMSMTIEEYNIYINDYNKKSKYPDISE
jgi:hypothetical protein